MRTSRGVGARARSSNLRVRLEVALDRQDADGTTPRVCRSSAAGLVERGDLDARHRARRGRARRPRCARGPRSASWPRRSAAAVRSGSSDLKMPEPTKYALGAELHHQRGVGRGGDAAGGEASRRAACPRSATSRTRSSGAWRSLAAVGSSASSSAGEAADLAADRAHVAHGLDDVAGAGLALRADHRRALGDAPQRLAQVGGAADERHLERPLVDVVGLVGGREHLGLVDVVDLERLAAPGPRRSGRCAPSP